MEKEKARDCRGDDCQGDAIARGTGLVTTLKSCHQPRPPGNRPLATLATGNYLDIGGKWT